MVSKDQSANNKNTFVSFFNIVKQHLKLKGDTQKKQRKEKANEKGFKVKDTLFKGNFKDHLLIYTMNKQKTKKRV